MKEGHEQEQHRQREYEVDQIGRHVDERQDFEGEIHLLDQVAIGDDRGSRVVDGGREPGPWQQAAEQEDRVMRDVDPHVDGEDKGVDPHHHERIEQAPEEAQGGSLVAGPHLSVDEPDEHLAVADQLVGLVFDLGGEQNCEIPLNPGGNWVSPIIPPGKRRSMAHPGESRPHGSLNLTR
ncbi:hypothetical protein D3C87_1647300 [compost metagenome]